MQQNKLALNFPIIEKKFLGSTISVIFFQFSIVGTLINYISETPSIPDGYTHIYQSKSVANQDKHTPHTLGDPLRPKVPGGVV